MDAGAYATRLGGGGLLSGIGVAFRALRPEAVVYAAEPATAVRKQSIEEPTCG